MLKPIAFAHSLAILSGVIYLGLYGLALIWYDAFRFLFNTQFFGADVASLLPRSLTYGAFVDTLVVLIIGEWVFAFAWAWLYNRLARQAAAGSDRRGRGYTSRYVLST